MTLYGRRVRVTVAGLTITQPRISFTVERQADETQTTGRVDIYNLAPARSQQIYLRSSALTLEAGYPSTIATIFEGQVQRVRHPRRNLAHVTSIELGDAVRDEGVLGGVTSRSYAGPVSMRQIALDLIADMGLQSVRPSAIPPDATVTDFVWGGPSHEGLTALLKRVDTGWYEEDGVVRFTRGDSTQVDAPRISVSPQTGLIGAPLETDEGAEATMFLNSQAKIGGEFNLQSVTLSGRYRIVGLRHEGDNWAGPFTTWCDLRDF